MYILPSEAKALLESIWH